MAKAKTLPVLPKQVFVKWVREDEDDPWLSVGPTTDGLDDGDLVGIYELKETRVKRVTHSLE